MAISKSKLKKALKAKFGFKPADGTKHEAFSLEVGGKKVASTRFSRNLQSSIISDNLLSQIAKQIGIPTRGPSTVRGMVTCSVSRNEYLRILRDGGFLE